MYASNKDFENYEIVLSDYGYPKETLIFEANEKDVMTPSFVRVIDTRPVPGRKINIEVADNGYVVKMGNQTKLATTDYNMRLESTINDFLNEEYDKERDLTESEQDDPDLQTWTLEMNVAYKKTK